MAAADAAARPPSGVAATSPGRTAPGWRRRAPPAPGPDRPGGWGGRWARDRGLGTYDRRRLGHDVVAGFMLTALLVPAGMGYATASSLPAVTGLYATVAALVAYALVGPSRILVLGPDSSLTPLIAAAVIPLAVAGAAGEQQRVALAGLLAVLSGAILLAGGLARLGFVSDLLSAPIRVGYLNGIALVVIVGQIPALLGFTIPHDGLIADIGAVVTAVRDGQVLAEAAALGLGSLAFILALRRAAPRAPGLLMAVAGASVATWVLGLRVPVVGALPPGLPGSAWGSLRLSDLGALAGPALGIAVVAYADTGVLSRALAGRTGGRSAPNREMTALGIANLASGVAGGFPVSASATRTPVAEAGGATTQVASVVGAAAVVAVLALTPGATTYLPASALAAVVIAAVMTLVDVGRTFRLARVDRREFALCLLAFAGVAVFGVLRGIAAAVVLSLAVFVARAWRPHTAELVRIDGRKGYHDRRRHPEGRQIPGLVIVRFDAPLFFANAELFADVVQRSATGASPPVRRVVVAAEPLTDIDTTAAEVLERLDDDLAAQGVRLVFAGLKGPVKDKLARYGLGARFPADRLYPTLGTAVADYVDSAAVDWTDWTDVASGDGRR